jgi:MoaA/NifB/PqqE/SkfB family radical SAM enzyme
MAAYKFSEIRKVHLEISSKCNASCSLCPRTAFGYPYNNGYIEHNMTVDEAQKIFSISFIKQLNELLINGNFGDAVANPNTVPIVRYFRENNPNLNISISTNGGAQNTDFWTSLAKLSVEVYFSIDGLDDTNHLYRQNTDFAHIMRNVNDFIGAGGTAIWKWVKFKHNEHQINEARQLANDLGFKDFITVWDGRDTGPVFNRHGDQIYFLGDERNHWLSTTTTVNEIIQSYNNNIDFRSVEYTIADTVDCEVMRDQSIYVSSLGDVYPCCYLGNEPRTFGKGTFMQAVNNQISNIMLENNALEYDLNHCIQWFKSIVDSWSIPTYEEGRLLQCNQTCGGRKRTWEVNGVNAI